MDSHVLRKMAWRLPALAGVAVLRFNTRGTKSSCGRSQGVFDGGRGEGEDVAAALDFVAERGLPDPWLLGWSFGTELALMHGRDPRVAGAVLLSPPLMRATDADLDAWAAFGRPLVVVVPELDTFLPPEQARPRFARVAQAELVAVPVSALCELVWVLTRGYGLTQAQAAAAVRALTRASNVVTDLATAEAGLAVLEAGGDFADGAIAHDGVMLGAHTFVTFDRKAARLVTEAGVPARLLEPTG